jgi:hypothetical protein
MSLKVTDSLQTKKRKRHFVHASESTRKNCAKVTELAYEEEGRKGKVAAKVAVI